MFAYKIEHVRKNILEQGLNDFAKQGWKLHSIHETTGGYMVILEQDVSFVSSSWTTTPIHPDAIPVVEGPSRSRRKTKKSEPMPPVYVTNDGKVEVAFEGKTNAS